jgi:hypothetical protein
VIKDTSVHQAVEKRRKKTSMQSAFAMKITAPSNDRDESDKIYNYIRKCLFQRTGLSTKYATLRHRTKNSLSKKTLETTLIQEILGDETPSLAISLEYEGQNRDDVLLLAFVGTDYTTTSQVSDPQILNSLLLLHQVFDGEQKGTFEAHFTNPDKTSRAISCIFYCVVKIEML